MPDQTLSASLARRIAVAAQFPASRAPTPDPGPRRVVNTVGALGALQLDAVNVLIRSHYLPLFSRLGPYRREHLEAAAWGTRRSLFEYWGHEASLMPVTIQPLFRWRMARARSGQLWSGLAAFGRERADVIAAALRRIERDGALTGGDLAEGPRQAGWWNWSDGKRALEWLFWAGAITTVTRRGFERVYDLTERALPRAVLETPTPSEEEAHRALLLIAARALGVATAGDLRDYFRLPPNGILQRLEELVEAGELVPTGVQGWRQRAYLATGARRPRTASGGALLSPFDNLIWRRERAERLFGARIRLEIYTPADRREHGYYVLPFLLGDRIVGRVDLKADRQAQVLRVQAAHDEQGQSGPPEMNVLADHLKAMCLWLGLRDVAVMRKGGLSAALQHAIG